MEPLAYPPDLANRLGVGFTTDAETYRAEALLADASAKVRNYTRQTITRVLDDTVYLEATDDQWLYFPERPVVSVSSIVVGGAPLSPELYYFQSDALYRYDGWSGRFYGSTGVWNQPDTIQVTYTHGWDSVPDDIVMVVCKLAQASWTNPQGFRSFTQGDMAATLDASTVGAGHLDADDKRVLDFYRSARRSVVLNASIL